jgi:DNA-binding NtrC family response regulator
VRELMTEVLEQSGYRVHSAANAAEALAVAGRIDGPVDLVVTDVVMPGEGGPELARRLAQARPALRVLFISGHLADTLDLAGARFLAKPFGLDDLLRTVEDMLQR